VLPFIHLTDKLQAGIVEAVAMVNADMLTCACVEGTVLQMEQWPHYVWTTYRTFMKLENALEKDICYLSIQCALHSLYSFQRNIVHKCSQL
jgi:hypothetical protein